MMIQTSPKTLENTKDELVDTLETNYDIARNTARDMVNTLADRLDSAQSEVESQLEEYNAKFNTNTKALSREANRTIKQNPFVVIGAAFLIGLGVGFLLRQQ